MTFSAFIEANLDVIVAEWGSFARTLGPLGAGMSDLALSDHCRDMLIAVAKDMQTSESEAQRSAKSRGVGPVIGYPETAAVLHGAMREMAGFELAQLVAEFRALRASVLRLWRQANPAMSDGVNVEEMIRFNEAIDQALAESVDRYMKQIARSRDMFVAMLGHDLRNPLSVVDASRLLLERPNLPESWKQQSLGRIHRATITMGRLIADLLGFTSSRMGAGIPIHRTDCDLRQLCLDALDSVRTTHPKLTFVDRLSTDLRVRADPARLEQLVTNLLYNAVQHGDAQSSISLDVDGDGDMIVLTVTNQGEPIPAEALPTIFEPLIRSANAMSRSQELSKTSLGLGLFIVREIARGHGGTISVDSTAATGTIFTVRFPRMPSDP